MLSTKHPEGDKILRKKRGEIGEKRRERGVEAGDASYVECKMKLYRGRGIKTVEYARVWGEH